MPDPKSNDPQPTSETRKGDLGAGIQNGHNAEPNLDPAKSLDQSLTDNAQSLRSIRGDQVEAANEGGIIIASITIHPGVQATIATTSISVGENQIVVAISTIP